MADEYRPKIGDRVAVVGEVTDVGIRNAWVRFGNDSGSTLMVPLEAVQSDATAELRDLFRRLAELEGAVEEREADMHMRIRADYDRTVADSWRAANARVTAERDQALARIAEPEGAATKPAEPAVTIHMQSRAPFVLAKADSAFSRQAAIYDTTIGWRFPNPRMKALYDTHSMRCAGRGT